MATPHVAGLAALVRSSCGYTLAGAIVNRITSNADAIAGTGSSWQFGRINALRSVCFPAPSNLRLGTVTSSSIQILWNDNTPLESSFQVNYRPHGTDAWLPAPPPNPGTNATSWTHASLAAGAGYDYRVSAMDGNVPSGWSNTVTGFIGGGFTLTVSKSGSGRVISTPAGINCGEGGNDCSEPYRAGTVVTLDAEDVSNPYDEWLFDHWEGACSGTASRCTLTMNADKSARAIFRVSGRG